MARPEKTNGDWFKYYKDFSQLYFIKAIRKKFTHSGKSVFTDILAVLLVSDNFRLKVNEAKYMQLSYEIEDVEPNTIKEILEFALELGALEIDSDGFIFSPYLNELMEPLKEKRKSDKEYYQSKTAGKQKEFPTSETNGNERKVTKTRGNKLKPTETNGNARNETLSTFPLVSTTLELETELETEREELELLELLELIPDTQKNLGVGASSENEIAFKNTHSPKFKMADDVVATFRISSNGEITRWSLPKSLLVKIDNDCGFIPGDEGLNYTGGLIEELANTLDQEGIYPTDKDSLIKLIYKYVNSCGALDIQRMEKMLSNINSNEDYDEDEDFEYP